MTVKQPSISQKRLHILDEEEIKAFYGQPHFTEEERSTISSSLRWKNKNWNTFIRSNPESISFSSWVISKHVICFSFLISTKLKKTSATFRNTFSGVSMSRS